MNAIQLYIATIVALLGACGKPKHASSLHRITASHGELATEDAAYAVAKDFLDAITYETTYDPKTQEEESRFFANFNIFRQNCEFDFYLQLHPRQVDSKTFSFSADVRAKTLNQSSDDRSVLMLRAISYMRVPRVFSWRDRYTSSTNYRYYSTVQSALEGMMTSLKLRGSACFKSADG